MITTRTFGTLPDGRGVTEYAITHPSGMWVAVLDYGCVVRTLRVPDGKGGCVDVSLGYDTLEEYLADDAHLGAVVGRCANRVGGGRFTLNGAVYQLATNDGPNHLHGGPGGFDHQLWEGHIEGGGTLTLTRVSPDGEEGYPGTLAASVTYELTDGGLKITYEGRSDKDTLFNPTSHIYFNLNGQGSGSALDHRLTLASGEMTENDDHILPTGRLLPVAGTPFDFRAEKPVSRDFPAGGYDHNFVITPDGKPVAALEGERSGVRMAVYTDRPGLQFYSGNFLTRRKGKGDTVYDIGGGLCLETQCWPDGINHPGFPSPVLRAGETFRSVTEYRFH